MFDLILRNAGSEVIEVLRAVRGFTDQRHGRRSEALEQRTVLTRYGMEGLGRGTRGCDQVPIEIARWPRHASVPRRVRTSLSEVGVKSWYHRPTATKGSGVRTHTTSSASRARLVH